MISPNRIFICQNPNKEGIIEIRPGVDELSLGERKYAQVRIFIGASRKFVKGMAIYSNDIPDEYDIVFYTRLKDDGNFAGYGTQERRAYNSKPFVIIDPPKIEWDARKDELDEIVGKG